MPENDDLSLLIRAARAAGEIAIGYFEGGNKVWDKGSDDPVTEADIAVDRLLREMLTEARPGYGWLSEETEDRDDRLSMDRVFIVDPIDGTRAFIAGEATWAHSIAVVERGQPVAGVVYLPVKSRLFAATLGGGAALNGDALTLPDRDTSRPARLLASRPALEPRHWPGGKPEVERHFRPSLAYRLCLVGQGRFDAMLTLRDSWEWDLAAGTLVATEAGATVTNRHGHPLRFNNPHPVTAGVLAAATDVHADLIDRLTPHVA